jgi:hypothetical protein
MESKNSQEYTHRYNITQQPKQGKEQHGKESNNLF